MENNSGSTGPLGPRPARRAPRPALSHSRAALLQRLQGQPEPTTLVALIAATGLHANTLREHLAALIGHGLVRRVSAEPNGRGRPAWLYEATTDDDGDGRSEYAGLAATLASAIHRNSTTPRDDAILAGTEWGRRLARESGAGAAVDVTAARRQVVWLLGELGFAPEPDEAQTVVRLTHCPLLEAANEHPDVVCGVHLGIVRGALEEYGADPTGTDLLPFAEPGACRLDLVARTAHTP